MSKTCFIISSKSEIITLGMVEPHILDICHGAFANGCKFVTVVKHKTGSIANVTF